MKRPRTIVYWSFVIDIRGPRHSRNRERRAVRRVLSRKRLRELEQAALQAVRAKLPTGFKALLS